jgi:glycine cleavage system H protein
MAEIKFSKTHEWVRVEGNEALMGISQYAQSQLGDIVFVEFPNKGDKVNKNDQIATIESTKAASEVYSPLSGEVIELNSVLNNNPEKINESPHEEGWILKLKISNKPEINELLTEAAYKEFVAQEKG